MEDQLHPNWKAKACANLKWKVFVQARSENEEEPEKVKNKISSATLSGEEAKKIYEAIVQENNDMGHDLASQPSPKTSESCTSGIANISLVSGVTSHGKLQQNIRTLHKAMSLAQNNEKALLTEILENGLDVDSKDEHGWSLLMVAACAGALDVVKLLLKYKVKTGVRDAKGNTAVYLAGIKGHTKIVDLIIKSQKKKYTGSEDSTATVCEALPSEFFCDVCKRTYKESTRLQHETSIVHQFHVGSVENKTVYGISPSNKGYQLLVNQGWNTEQGLGSDNNGIKFPVKTVLKRNREGIGGPSHEKAKITHFGPGDKDAIKGGAKSREQKFCQRTLDRRKKKNEKLKERRKEADLRRILYEPDF